ncbi:MAG: flagellar motor stator protein MotA [Bryobacterales bacterium]|nr:flagellar motor stator protein MotA [Bryobacterales bacterium]
MFVIIGFVVVIGAIVGGYLMEHGNLMVLMQPAELVIIGGAGLGTLLIANPLHILIDVLKGMIGTLKGSPFTKPFYVEQLRMLNDIFVYARKNGMAKLEADLDEPDKSQLFGKYPKFLKDHHALHFFCDTVRMSISGGVAPFELDQLMELDLDVQHHGHAESASALTTVADALPGIGIVACVLGIVITMGALGGPPEEIGHKVAAALVGTFLGILLCYGFLSPLASNMSKIGEAHGQYMQFLRIGVLAFVKGTAPSLAVEFARRGIPLHIRPSFKETEAAIKGGGAAPAA